MEGGIKADQNFFSRRPSFSSPDHQQHQRYDLPGPPEFEARSPELPPKLPFLTTQNLQAVDRNANVLVGGGLSNGRAQDPDEDWYRNQHSVQQIGNNYLNNLTSDMPTASEARSVQSSLRSNGNGTTPKHPSLAQARNQLKPSTYRSASSPLDDRPGLNLAKSTPALNGIRQVSGSSRVRDISKQFEKKSNDQAPAVLRKPSRINTSAAPAAVLQDREGYRSQNGTSSSTGTSSRAGTATREANPKSPTLSRPTRTKFAVEDQESNNVLSGSARVTKQRNGSSSINQKATKSMSNLSPTSPTAPPQAQTSRPLFGEIIASEGGIINLGYGIPSATGRRTSDSSLHQNWQGRSNSKSDLDISPDSPTAWYKGHSNLDDVEQSYKPRSRSHNRNHSDFPDSKVNTMNGVSPSFQTASSAAPVQIPSRLPLPSKRQSSSSTSSVPSSRSNSPFTSNAITNSKLRKPEQQPWSPAAARANTPTARAKTPTARNSPRGKGRTSEKSTSNAPSLSAYVTPLPSKSSPQLRSSRPRQFVSSATSANSRPRPRPNDNSGSPQQIRTGMKVTRNVGEGFKAREQERKISDVPLTKVDFAARRELITRAYTKSLDEHQQKEKRAANLRRLQEGQQAKAAAAAKASEEVSHDVEKDEEPVLAEAAPILEAPIESKPSPQPLQISTSFTKPEVPSMTAHQPQDNDDSPTLGMPGGYVEDEPASAISCATGITEFDNEPQTEAPRMSHLPSRPDSFSSNLVFDDFMSPEQAYYGMQNMSSPGDESIQIMLDATPVEEPQQSTPTNDVFARDPSPPGAYQESPELAEEQPVFTSTVTVASPQETTPVYSRPPSPIDSCDDQTSSNEESPIISHEARRSELESQDVPLQVAPAISLPHKVEYPEPEEQETRLQLPALRTALAPSVIMNGLGQDYLHTPVTDIDYDSSDGGLAATSGGEGDYDRGYLDSSREDLDSTRNRLSHHSAWTDYSIGTTTTNDGTSEPGGGSRPATAYENQEEKPAPPPKEHSPVVPPKPEGYSPMPSPRTVPETYQPMRLPPITTGEGLGIGFDHPRPFGSSPSLPLWPEYSSPPVPQAGDVSPAPPSRTPPPPHASGIRPASSLYQSSQNENGRSRRASDEVSSPRPSLSTPRSSTQISFDDTTNDASSKATTATTVQEPVLESEEEKQAAEKTRKRLYQRKMVIKELIETESVYLKDMSVVEEIYKGTAEACPNLDSSDVKTIFRNTADIISFSGKLLEELKSAASSIYSPRSRARQSKAVVPTGSSTSPSASDRFSIAATLTTDETDDEKDRKTFIGANFRKQLKRMQVVYTDFLKNNELASTRLATLQQDPAVQVWLSECNLVAKDLTRAWDLDALMVKPVQRITRYPLLLKELAESTPADHPDFEALDLARKELTVVLEGIDEMKKRIEMVGKIVGRKRKESDVRTNLAKAFGRRAERLQSSANRPPDDPAYHALHNTFGVEFLRLQVVLRDVEDYARHQKEYVAKTLQYFSSMELIMRMSASRYPEIESKWVRFNLSMRDMGTIAIDDHIGSIQKEVVEPLEKVIQMYTKPGDAMQKRNKRRIDYEKSLNYKSQGKKIDEKLAAQVAQYEALNETLKIELPKLSALTKTLGRLCQIRLLFLKTEWYGIWQKKLTSALEASQLPKNNNDILDMFHRDFKYTEAKLAELGISNGTFGTFGSGSVHRGSQSTDADDSLRKNRPSNLSGRSRGPSVASDRSPSIPTPEFAKRSSGQFTFSPIVTSGPGLPQFSYPSMPYSNGHSRAGPGSPVTPDTSTSRQHHQVTTRPSTSRSHTSENGMVVVNLSRDRGNSHSEYSNAPRRESASTYNSQQDPTPSSRPFSGLFHSAMPMTDGVDERMESQRSSRASSRDRNMSGGYNVLYLAASLFEFNISATKSEAGYPYLTYQAGEIFDVIGEKGELWLAKNQDDPSDEVGWIWSKHFARLAAD